MNQLSMCVDIFINSLLVDVLLQKDLVHTNTVPKVAREHFPPVFTRKSLGTVIVTACATFTYSLTVSWTTGHRAVDVTMPCRPFCSKYYTVIVSVLSQDHCIRTILPSYFYNVSHRFV